MTVVRGEARASPPAGGNRAVQAYWEEAPCGTREVAGLEERARFAELRRRRYEREPFIPRFAGFAASRGLRVLEVGCGAGTDLVEFARHGALATAVDLSMAGVSIARRRLEAEGLAARVLLADAEALPFADSSFDVVYSWGVIHHGADAARAAAELLRVLRPGGRFCVMVYNRRSLVALQTWIVFGLGRGRPHASVAELLAAHMESPGTRAFPAREALALFAAARERALETVVTPYDLRLGRRRFLPAWMRSLVPSTSSPAAGDAGVHRRNASSAGRTGRLSHGGRRSPPGPGAGRARRSQSR